MESAIVSTWRYIILCGKVLLRICLITHKLRRDRVIGDDGSSVSFVQVYKWSDAESSGMTVNRGPLKTAEEVHTNNTVLTLLGLEPNTRYTICIEAVNSGMILDHRF